MTKVIEVKDLRKEYPAFTLDNVSFVVESGHIVGFIGRNGAGKSTTIKGMLNIIATSGEVRYFGKDFRTEELALKSRIGYVGGGFGFYKSATVGKIADTVATFYDNWDEAAFRSYCEEFMLDRHKKISALSQGMQVKFSLALALSHGAEVLILDEPTSGLDPVSREEFADIMLRLAREKGVTVMFSTHITSDIMRIADDIVYIAGGKILAAESLDSFLDKYVLVTFASKEEADAYYGNLIGLKAVKSGYEGLVERATLPEGTEYKEADLDSIMVHLEEDRKNAD